MAYFESYEKLSSVLSLTMGFFRTFGFLSLIEGFSSGAGGTYLTTLKLLVGFRLPNIGKESFWLSSLISTEIPYNADSCELLDSVHVDEHLFSKSGFIWKLLLPLSKTLVQFGYDMAF